MLSNVTIVAVTHRNVEGLPSRLIDDYGDRVFEAQILPEITDNTLIVAEGAFVSGIHSYADRLYQISLGDICPSLAKSGKQPKIIYNDFLQQVPKKKLVRKLQQISAYDSVIMEYLGIDWNMVPKEFEKFPDALQRKDVYTILRKPTQLVVDLARAKKLMNEKRNKAFVKGVERALKLSDQVLLICGMSHALDIHINEGWPIVFLVDPSNDLMSPDVLFYAALVTNHVPQAILEEARD